MTRKKIASIVKNSISLFITLKNSRQKRSSATTPFPYFKEHVLIGMTELKSAEKIIG